jgi:hypothetical protein
MYTAAKDLISLLGELDNIFKRRGNNMLGFCVVA